MPSRLGGRNGILWRGFSKCKDLEVTEVYAELLVAKIEVKRARAGNEAREGILLRLMTEAP